MNIQPIPIEYIIAFAMAVTNVVKRTIPDKDADAIPFIAFFLSILFNVVNALSFNGNILEAGQQAFISAGVSLAIFSGGSALGRKISP